MNFSIKLFYKIAIWLAVFGLIGNVINMFIIWPTLNLGSMISTLSMSILFNVLILFFFVYMYKVTPNADPGLDLQKLFSSLQQKDIIDLKNNQKEVIDNGIVQEEEKN